MLLIISRCAGVFLRNTLKPSVLSSTECHSFLNRNSSSFPELHGASFVLALFSTLPRFRCVSICSLTARHYPCFPSGPSLHWPLAATRRLCHRQFSGRRGAGHRRGDAKHHAHSPDILSLRQDCPNSASVSGSCSLLDGTSALVVGSFCLNQPHQDFLMNSRL